MKRTHLLAATVGTIGLASLACSGNVRNEASKLVPLLDGIGGGYEHIQCDDDISTPSHRGCKIATITCGDSVEGNTQFGLTNWGDDMYQKAFCTPNRHDYDKSPESVYELVLPGDVEAHVRLDSNCADLDVVAISWPDASSCPKLAHHGRIRECEMDTAKGGGTVTLTTVTKQQTYLVAVDGKNGATGNYRLTVSCNTYR